MRLGRPIRCNARRACAISALYSRIRSSTIGYHSSTSLEGCDICFGVRRAKDKHDQSCIALNGANATISTNALLAQVLATKSIANYDLGSISLIDNMSWADIFCANSRLLKRIPAAPAVVHAYVISRSIRLSSARTLLNMQLVPGSCFPYCHGYYSKCQPSTSKAEQSRPLFYND